MNRTTRKTPDGLSWALPEYMMIPAINKLAAYEDTGLTPEELKQIFPTKLGVKEARERAERAREIYGEWYEYDE